MLDQLPKNGPRVPLPSNAGKKRAGPTPAVVYDTFAVLDSDAALVVVNPFNEFYVYSTEGTNRYVRQYSELGVLQWELSRATGGNNITLSSMSADASDGSVAFVISDTTVGSFEVQRHARDGSLIYRKEISTLTVDSILAITGDSDGNIYVGYADIGVKSYVVKLDTDGDELWTSSNTLDDDGITSIYLASTGDFYVGTRDGTSQYISRLNTSTGAVVGSAIQLLNAIHGDLLLQKGPSKSHWAEDNFGQIVIGCQAGGNRYIVRGLLDLGTNFGSNNRVQIDSLNDRFESFFLDNETDQIYVAGDEGSTNNNTRIMVLDVSTSTSMLPVDKTVRLDNVFGGHVVGFKDDKMFIHGEVSGDKLALINIAMVNVITSVVSPVDITNLTTTSNNPATGTSIAARVWISDTTVFAASAIAFTLTVAESIVLGVNQRDVMANGESSVIQSEV